MQSVSDSLVRNKHTSSLLEVILYSSSCSSSLKGADTSAAPGLMPFYSPVQLSLCNSRSPGISFMLLRLSWETQQTFLYIWMCHPGGAGLPVQPDWAAVQLHPCSPPSLLPLAVLYQWAHAHWLLCALHCLHCV
ncbi:unnamed protein product [Pleuronectes platessa]|uniref:Uncharacterized protein n=1 Tax=Pleuronectes platessa TaxID=8262 RepID=A0A9N7UDP1_PLEPL|nr:unnamed protein product [Pleuronectes platessa]